METTYYWRLRHDPVDGESEIEIDAALEAGDLEDAIFFAVSDGWYNGELERADYDGRDAIEARREGETEPSVILELA